MTLQQVHQRSGRRWSPVVLGSYERADRAIALALENMESRDVLFVSMPEMKQLVLREPALEKRPGIDAGRGVALEVDEIAAEFFVRGAEEVTGMAFRLKRSS